LAKGPVVNFNVKSSENYSVAGASGFKDVLASVARHVHVKLAHQEPRAVMGRTVHRVVKITAR
jgi:hypothetical protein